MSLTCITGFAGFSVTSKWNGSEVSGPDGTTRRCRFVFDQIFDGIDERDIKLVRESEVEQHRLAGGLLQLVEIEAAAECGGFGPGTRYELGSRLVALRDVVLGIPDLSPKSRSAARLPRNSSEED
jgi:hypothetical protein